MFKNPKDLETLIYRCLLHARDYSPNKDGHDLYFDDENHDLYDINYAWKEAASLKYVSGIKAVYDESIGEFRIDGSMPKLTLAGFKFIENFKP